jgi:alkane 1-monooxygenase
MNAKLVAIHYPSCKIASDARFFASHLLCLVLPTTSLVFLSTGPHDWHIALLWTLPVWLFILADVWSPSHRDDPPPGLSSQPFIGVLIVLAMLQIANIALMFHMIQRLPWSGAVDFAVAVANLLATRILVGTSSCCCGIVAAHELIHRPQRELQLLGRLLLCLVCYEHFAIEHIRGHHRNASTPADHASARFGESYAAFWRRTAAAQFKSAWRFESARLGMTGNAVLDKRLLTHEVFWGVLLEVALLGLIGWHFGLLAVAMFLLQALAAVRLLEAVNYFQHWGLSRRHKRFATRDAWVTDSWVTLYVFLGLARHADHHARPGQPYQTLKFSDAGPKLPYGYFGMALLAKSFNRHFQRLAIRELEARHFGPFQDT